MSAILALSAAQYVTAKNNALYSMMNASNARLGLLSSPMMNNPSFGSLEALSAMDTQYELDMINNNVQYLMAKAMLEQIKKLQKEETKQVNFYA